MRQRVKQTAVRVHHHINRHALGWVLFLAAALIIGLQVAWPLDRALPFARLGREAVGGRHYEQLAGQLNKDFMEMRVALSVDGGKSISFAPAEAGAQPKVEEAVNKLTDYPLWQRLIPLSIFVQTPSVTALGMEFESRRLESFSREQAAVLSVAPRDAGLAIRDGQLVMTDDVPGAEVKFNDVRSAVSKQQYELVFTTVQVSHRKLSAEKPSAYFAAVKSQAETAIGLPLEITAGDKVYTPDRATIASWLAVGEDEQKHAALKFNDEAIDAYINKLQTETMTASTPTHVTRVDGRESAREEGTPGRILDVADLKSQLSRIIQSGGNAPVTAKFVAVAPTVLINRKYNSTQAGLQAYISDQAASRNVRISVQQIGGNGWSASARGDESTVSASTYKLYVALYLFHLMEQGKLSWDTPILDTNVRGCMERMLVASTNACAEQWLRQYGDGTIEQYAWSRGFSRGTQFTNPEANHTTTNDLTKFMRGLNDGSLLSGEYRDYTLSALIRHHYKKGIPGGSAGEVHNKVGFLWDYSNDSAVVYHPRGAYVIAVITKGLSFYAIADITREIEAIMYP